MSKGIKKELRRQVKQRANNFYIQPNIAKNLKIIGVLGLASFVINLGIIVYHLQKGHYNDKYDMIFVLSGVVFWGCFSAYAYLMSFSPPVKEKNFDIDNWIYSVELKKRMIKFIGSLCIFILSSYLFFKFDLNELYSSLIAFVGSINYLLYNIILLYTIYHPNVILNSFLTGIGSGMKLLSYSLIIIGIRGIIVMHLVDNIFVNLILIVVIGLAARFVIEYDRQYILIFGRGLDYVQLKAIKVIKPINIVSIIRKDNMMLKDKQKALELVQKLKESNDYGVMYEFADLIKYNSKNNFKWLWGFVFCVILYVLDSIGEGIVQDLFKDTVKEFLCKVFGLLCEK